jgi:hypothetical protein
MSNAILFPNRTPSLSHHVPRCVQVNERHFVFLDEIGKGVFGQFDRMDAFLLVHLFQR